MDGSSSFFQMLYLSLYCIYRLVYRRPSTSYRVEPIAEGLIESKSAQPFLRTSQSVRFGTHFHDHVQLSNYTCTITLLTTILLPLCYGELFLKMLF